VAKAGRIPPFDVNGNLPPGVYYVHLGDIETRFTWTEKRVELFQGLTAAAINLASAGVALLYIDGSFITNKDDPSDVDGCWVYDPRVNAQLLDHVFKTENQKANMKQKYGVDFLVHGYDQGPDGKPIEGWFQEDEDGNEKGILLLKF
jgi:hypothetical protein